MGWLGPEAQIVAEVAARERLDALPGFELD